MRGTENHIPIIHTNFIRWFAFQNLTRSEPCTCQRNNSNHRLFYFTPEAQGLGVNWKKKAVIHVKKGGNVPTVKATDLFISVSDLMHCILSCCTWMPGACNIQQGQTRYFTDKMPTEIILQKLWFKTFGWKKLDESQQHVLSFDPCYSIRSVGA